MSDDDRAELIDAFKKSSPTNAFANFLAVRAAMTRGDSYRKSVQVVGPAFEKWLPNAPDEEIITYMDTMKASGEKDAFAWLIQLHPELKDAGRQMN